LFFAVILEPKAKDHCILRRQESGTPTLQREVS
jgi:hypothetical protein